MNHTSVDLYHQAYAHLHSGDYATGFRLFEYRWHPDAIATLDEPFEKYTPSPVWKGEPLQGKSIVVQMEMGYGDCIQFMRFLPILKVLGASKLVVLSTLPLAYLYAQIPCVDHITNNEKEGISQECDYWIGSMSLPSIALTCPTPVRALFPITQNKVIGSEGYLDAKPSQILPFVGVNWGASRRYLHGIKSTTSERMVELVGKNAYSLNPEEDGPFIKLPDNGWKKDWQKTAEHMKSMKAVVTVDTGTAHMAGALGVKCIVLLPEDDYVCWRWKNAVWYDSVIALRQHEWNRVPKLLKEI
jgi:hypothetical protein